MIFVHELNIAAIKELFVLMKLIHFFFLISCSYTILYKNSNFSLSWALPNLVQKLWPCIHAQNMQKVGFEFYIMWNFVKKKILISKEFAILCKTGFVWIQNWCEISCNKSYFVQKHVFTGAQELYCFVKTLFFYHCW